GQRLGAAAARAAAPAVEAVAAAPEVPDSAVIEQPRRRARDQATGVSPGAGFDTKRLPAAQKRHGRSIAFEIPIRRPAQTAAERHAAGRDEITIGPQARSAPFKSSSTPSA